MHTLPALFLSLVAVLVLAVPVLEAGDETDITLFKRDASLTPRDLESAAMHGVNITESTYSLGEKLLHSVEK